MQTKVITSNALFSPDGTYRYKLLRIWATKKKLACIIGLNPSTADEVQDDPTVRRCIAYAQEWGYGGLWLGNLFALRATDPKKMLFPYNHLDPIGEENDEHLREMAERSAIVVGAWGNWGEVASRGKTVIKMFPTIKCLGLTARGQPRHPLYLRKGIEPREIKEARDCPFVRIRSYPDCYEDCPDTNECPRGG